MDSLARRVVKTGNKLDYYYYTSVLCYSYWTVISCVLAHPAHHFVIIADITTIMRYTYRGYSQCLDERAQKYIIFI